MIWCTEHFSSELIDHNLVHTELYGSDHLLISSVFTTNVFQFKNRAKLRQQRILRTTYFYDQMNDDKWTNYQNYMTTLICDDNLDNPNLSVNSVNINDLWIKIRIITLKAAKKHITNRKSCLRNPTHPYKSDSKIYRDLNAINKIYHAFRKSQFGQLQRIPSNTWLLWYHNIKSICITHKLPFSLP